MTTSGYTETSEEGNISDNTVTWSPTYEPQQIPLDIAIIGAIGGLAIIVFGVLGNLLLLLGVCLTRSLRTIANAPIASMAVLGILEFLVVHVQEVSIYFVRTYNRGARMCIGFFLMSIASNLALLFHILVITFYRYLVILRPRVTQVFMKRWCITLIIALIYILSPILTFPAGASVIGSGVYIMGVSVLYNTKIMYCENLFSKKNNIGGAVPFFAFLIFFILCIVGMYIKIYFVVKKSAQNVERYLQESQNAQPAGGHHGNADVPRLAAINHRKMRKEYRLVRSLLIVLGLYLVTYSTKAILDAVERNTPLPRGAHLVGILLHWAAPAVNWLVFGLMNTPFRRAYRHILCCHRNKVGTEAAASLQQAPGTNSTQMVTLHSHR